MAHLHTSLPTHAGELSLARQLSALQDDRLHLWFSLNHIPGVRDVDLLVWHEDEGVFVIEVKAVPLSMIKVFGWANCQIAGRPAGRSPQIQAAEARDSLLDHLRIELGAAQIRPPFMVASVAWPSIARHEWNAHWSDSRFTGEFSKTMFFSDDFGGGPLALQERLTHVWRSPPAKQGSDRRYEHDARQIQIATGALNPSCVAEPAPSEYERLKQIESRVASSTIASLPVGSTVRTIFRGHPGTGKTFRLLQLGVAHAMEGARVLFSCYNKVLGADIVRLLSLSNHLDSETAVLEVQDVFGLLSGYSRSLGLEPEADDYEAWGELVSEEVLRKSAELPKYDLVLVDEAQDMSDWALELLSAHCEPAGSLCLAVGTGQGLYGDSESWLARFAESADVVQLRRNFRNTKPVFQFAHVFYEAAPDSTVIARALTKFTSGERTLALPLFERRSGQLPVFREVDDQDLPWESVDTPWFADSLRDTMSARYGEIFSEQITELAERERPVDLLILVPSGRSPEHAWAVDALRDQGIAFLDYTEQRNRRLAARSDRVRLCTYHSARGLEGYRVVVLGLECLDRLAESVGVDLTHLGYMLMSRAVFECVIVRRTSTRGWPAMQFTAEALNAVRRIQP